MIILVVNAGSSSLKYQLINMDDESVIAKGNCDRIGIDGHISHKTSTGKGFEEDCSQFSLLMRSSTRSTSSVNLLPYTTTLMLLL